MEGHSSVLYYGFGPVLHPAFPPWVRGSPHVVARSPSPREIEIGIGSARRNPSRPGGRIGEGSGERDGEMGRGNQGGLREREDRPGTNRARGPGQDSAEDRQVRP